MKSMFSLRPIEFPFYRHSMLRLYEAHVRFIQIGIVISSITLLVLASTYTAIEGSRVLDFTSDSFISTFMAADWRPGGTVNLVSQHTNIMKYPILALQGWLHYNYFTYILINILLMNATTLGWSYITWRIFKKSYRAFTASNFMLAGLLLGSTALVVSLVSTTTRNIEYPLALLYVLLLRGLIETSSRIRWVLSVVLLAMLVSSDFIFLYALVPAALFVMVWFYWNKLIGSGQLLRAASSTVIGTALGWLLLKVLVILHILTLTGRHAGSFTVFLNLPHDIYNTFGQIIELCGGFFFGSPIKLSYSGAVLCFLFVVASCVAAYQTLHRFSQKRPDTRTFSTHFLPIVLVIWAIALCIFYILLGQAGEGAGDNSRYLSAIPFIAVFLQIVQDKQWRHKSTFVIITALICVGGLMNSYHGYFSYRNSIHANPQVAIDKQIISYARAHNIKLVLGSYDYGPALRFYSQNNPASYAILVCDNTFYFFSYNKWYLPQKSVTRSALIIDKYYGMDGHANAYNSTNSCSDTTLEHIYGAPAAKALVAAHNDQPVYILTYNYDIRIKLKNSDIIYL